MVNAIVCVHHVRSAQRARKASTSWWSSLPSPTRRSRNSMIVSCSGRPCGVGGGHLTGKAGVIRDQSPVHGDAATVAEILDQREHRRSHSLAADALTLHLLD